MIERVPGRSFLARNYRYQLYINDPLEGRESGGCNYDKCCFHVSEPWLVETLLKCVFTRSDGSEEKTLGRSVLSRNDHCALADPCSPRRSMKPHRHFFALSSSSSFASGKSTFLPLPFFRTVDIVNARDSSTTAQVKKHSSHRRG